MDSSNQSAGGTPLRFVVGLLAAVLAGPAFADAATTTTLVVTSAGVAVTSVASGTAVTLTAAVTSSGTAVTPGAVTFCDTTINATCSGLAEIGTAQLTTGGSADIVLRLGVGPHTLEAVFAGTNAYPGSVSSTSALAVTGKYGSATTISSTSGSATGVYDLTATISGFVPLALAAPTGTVNFLNTGNSNAQLATASLSTGTVSNALNFVDSSIPAVSGLIPSSAATGDFNEDGNLDFAVADQTNRQIAVFVGKGDGTFQAGATYTVGKQPVSLTAADLNNDGRLDLVLCNFMDSTISVLLGNGDGTFQSPQNYPVGVGPVSLTLGDLNGDGLLDLILAVDNNLVPSCIPFGSVEVLLGNGDGTFQSPQDNCLNTPLGGAEPQFVTAGDFNGDGKLDVVTANTGNEANYNISILLGNGDGTLQPAQFPWPFSVNQPSSGVVVGDFNGDSKLDLAVSNVSNGDTGPGQSSYSIFLGNGDGTFQAPATQELPVNTDPFSIQIADFNADGKADLAIGNSVGSETGGFSDLILVLLGNGDGTFQPQVGYDSASTNYGYSRDFAVGDFNGDSKPDLVLLEQTYPAMSLGPAILLNTGASTTVTVSGVAVPGSGSQLVEASYGGDSVYLPSNSAAISLTPIAAAPVTWANPAAITYGTALSASELNAASTVSGKFAYTPAEGTVLGAGMQTLTVVFTPTDATDYTPTTQTVILAVNPAPLTASANNAARVFGAVNPAFAGTITGAVNGDTLTESFATPATGASPVGNYPILPAVNGAALANYTITATNGSLTITQAGTTTLFALANQNLTLTATVASVTTGVPTGSVTFYSSQTLIGTAPLVAGVASYAMSAIPAADTSITAQYSGDPDFSGSSSPAIAILATIPAVASLTVAQTGSVTDTLTIAAAAGYAGTLQFSCSGLPQNSTCSFQPSSVTMSGMNSPAKVTLTIQTGQTSAAEIRSMAPTSPSDLPLIPAVVFWIPSWLATTLVGGTRRSRSRPWMGTLMFLTLAAMSTLVACGSGSGSGNMSSQTPAGTSIVQVIVAASGNLTQNVTLTLTVQ